MIHHVTTHNHLGDAAIMTGAVHNVISARPDIRIRYSGAGEQLFEGMPVETGDDGTQKKHVKYGTLEHEQMASNGNLVEGFTADLCREIGIPMVPIVTRTPWLKAEPDPEFAGKVILNANCQKCSMSKRYPFWQQVVDEVRKYADVVQIGGREGRDISPELVGVTDMRGRTGDIRRLMSIVKASACVMCPPTSLMNIAAGLGTPGVIVVGSREAEILSGYPYTTYISQPSCGYDGTYSGCVCLTHDPYDHRGCGEYTCIRGEQYSRCMAEVHPLRIAAAVRRILDGRNAQR